MAENTLDDQFELLSIQKKLFDQNQIWRQIEKSIQIEKFNSLLLNAPLVPNKIRVVCISDTHDRIPETPLPKAHILIHAGDLTMHGQISEIEKLKRYLSSLRHIEHKVLIAGNHDKIFDPMFERKSEQIAHAKNLLKEFHYLEDNEINLYGLKIYGSPWQPYHHGNAFQLNRGDEILSKWEKIPLDTDILITHGPPLGIGDSYGAFKHAGCFDLLRTVRKIKPSFHIFGHLHSAHGSWTVGNTVYINASICNNHYKPIQKPILFDIDPKI